MKRIAIFLAQGAGLGRLPFIPATFGSLWGVVLWLTFCSSLCYIATLFVVIIGGTLLADIAEKESGIKDDRKIVVDEIAGFLITMIGLPRQIPWLVAGFILFRLLDIIKPPPINSLQNLRGGLGIMADDVAAGVLGCCLLHLVRLLC
ncbi:phosphatidylglycerophosphatase A [bacterium]|nr:phosphatidylglycerophosphatase A [bacterium]MBU1599127.1 phosphatidylglycerophosphatase A [bacterium]MBU2462335.1 phosphatidylglycerophosphatase A [bacterium]